jgi:hypothetical protein
MGLRDIKIPIKMRKIELYWWLGFTVILFIIFPMVTVDILSFYVSNAQFNNMIMVANISIIIGIWIIITLIMIVNTDKSK